MEQPYKKVECLERSSILLYFKCAAYGFLCIYIVWSAREILELKKEVEKLSSSHGELDTQETFKSHNKVEIWTFICFSNVAFTFYLLIYVHILSDFYDVVFSVS